MTFHAQERACLLRGLVDRPPRGSLPRGTHRLAPGAECFSSRVALGGQFDVASVSLRVHGLEPLRHVHDRGLFLAYRARGHLERDELVLLERVLIPREHPELSHHLPPQLVLGQHPLHSLAQHERGFLVHHLPRRSLHQSSHVPGVTIVLLLIHLPSRQRHLRGVHHHHHVPLALVRLVRRLVLALQQDGELGRQPPDHLAARIHEAVPETLSHHIADARQAARELVRHCCAPAAVPAQIQTIAPRVGLKDSSSSGSRTPRLRPRR